MNKPLIPVSEEVAAKEHTDRLIATAFRDDSPLPQYGDAPPVQQPGIPPQSKAAVDYAVRVLSTGVATGISSGGVALVLLASQAADPLVCGIVFGAPIGLAVPIAALAGLLRRAWQAAPDVTINNYNGTVHQQTTHSSTRGVWAKTNHRH
ncbi:hypothetical protein [Streptomyces longwoodensis]|uniref:hypothetical protein n=1 Tax=Streptomyces longwoodensis TaxID=68231 RepID=UPI0037F96B46